MVKVLTILGSPRKNGNGQELLQQVLEGITSVQGDVEIESISVCKENIKPCRACDACQHQLGCIVKDDMQQMYPKFDQADLIIVTSPIYFNAVSAQLKAMIDRCQAIWSSKYVLHQPMIDRNKKRLGLFIATAGTPEGIAEFEPSIRVMDLFFKAINTEYYDNLLVPNIDKTPVRSQPQLLQQAYAIGSQMIKKFNEDGEK